MPEPTDEKLRDIGELIDRGASYEEYPDGVTWGDLDLAQKLKNELENNDA